MSAYITITSGNGVFAFADYDMPIVRRRMSHRKQGDDVAAATSISMSLSGWFEGNDHSEVVTKYQTLINILKVPDAKITYYDGSSFVLNDTIIFIDGYDEPSEWKQYTGNYNVNFHYIEELSHSSYLNLNASYSSSAGSYAFETTPLWSSRSEKVRGDMGHEEYTPLGNKLGEKIIVTLEGELAAQNKYDLASKMGLMEQAFSEDGVLNYGIWSNTVSIASPPQFSPTLPHYTCKYRVSVGYTSKDLYNFSCTRTYTRIHNMPEIRKRRHCTTDFVKEWRESGQEITYNLSARGENLSNVRALLRAEAWNLIAPGGIEMEGGTEVQDDIKNSISITIKKFYLTPILTNIEI